jgi:hypothetical protein
MVRQKKNASAFFDLRLVHQDRDEENVEGHQILRSASPPFSSLRSTTSPNPKQKKNRQVLRPNTSAFFDLLHPVRMKQREF